MQNSKKHNNGRWADYSQAIAIQILDRMHECKISQVELAGKLGCSQQYVSKILRGKENLSLETIAKIEDALNLSLIPEHFYKTDDTPHHSAAEEKVPYNATAPELSEQNDLIMYRSKDGKISVALMTRDGNVWLNRSQIATLFGTSIQNAGQHIANILAENELDSNSVVKYFFTTASDGKEYNVQYYSLQMIIAVGFRVRGIRGTQFRQWANRHLAEYLVKGFTMDDERLKKPDGRPDYFDELLARIRDIRASEKRFYQKLRDLFSLSSDYEAREKATQMFFAETQNKLLFAVTGNTAAELILKRADSDKPNMGLTSWNGNIVRRGDITIAKNYLDPEEIDKLNHLVTIFLESAEMRVKERKDLTLDFWRNNVNSLLQFQGQKVLEGNGSVSNARMEEFVKDVYDRFDDRRKKFEAELADNEDKKLLEELEKYGLWNH